MDYQSLIADKNTAGSIAAWLNNSTITSTAPDLVSDAESWVFRRLRHWRMLSPPTPGTLTVGSDTLAIPDDMLEPYLFWLTGRFFQFLPQRLPHDVIAAWGYDANENRVQQQPIMYYFDQDSLRLDSEADKPYNYMLIYYRQPAPLAATNRNFITQFYPRLFRCALMAAATEWAKDSGVGQFDRTYWDQLAMVEIEQAQIESDRAKRATETAAILSGGGITDVWRGAPWL